MENQASGDKLSFYGGKALVFLPITLALIGLIYIASKNANIPEYWVVFLLPLIAGIFFAKNKKLYSEVIIRGMTSELAAILMMAVILAGICGAIINNSNVVLTLANYLVAADFVGGKFVAATFLLTCVIAFSTGTSTGTIFVVGPILYPVGYLVGASPAMVIGAIVSGGAFGDNLSPVSDTTIASATTQGMDLGGVVKSRLKYSIPAAMITLIIYFFFSGKAEVMEGVEQYMGVPEPKTLLFLLIPAVIIYFCLRQRHLVEALSYGVITGLAVGLVTGVIKPGDIVSVPEQFGAGGIVLEGIQGAVPTVIIVMLLFVQVNLLKEGGGIEVIMSLMSKFVKGVRSAEATIVSILVILNIATGLNTAAILGTGELANRLGKKYDIDGYRRANLLDCAGTTFNYLLPYMVPVVVGSMLSTMYPPFEGAMVVTPVDVVTHQFYPWVMLAILIFAIITGYGRTFISDASAGLKRKTTSVGKGV